MQTEFAVVVIYQGKTKSGGHVRYDVAEVVNNNFSSNCPLTQTSPSDLASTNVPTQRPTFKSCSTMRS
jgi:hypothetical protein